MTFYYIVEGRELKPFKRTLIVHTKQFIILSTFAFSQRFYLAQQSILFYLS